jgi:hypothetical protein
MYGRSGELCPSWGVKRSAETCEKIALTKRGRKFPKISAVVRMRNVTFDSRKRMSIARKKAIVNGLSLSGFVKKQYVQGWYNNVHFRSSYEFGFMLMMEACGLLSRLQSETLRLKYMYHGEDHVYVVDFFDPVDGVAYEIKHSKNVDDPINIEKFAAARAFCSQNGYEFRVVTERDLDGFLLRRKQIEEHVGVTLYKPLA